MQGVFRYAQDGQPTTAFPSAAHDVRAVVEGQFLSMKSRTVALLPETGGKARRIIATGGTSSNRSVLQILADVMDADVYCYTSTAGASIGGAVLGLIAWQGAQGHAASVSDVEDQDLKLMVRPDAAAVRVYDELLPRWQAAEQAVIDEYARGGEDA